MQDGENAGLHVLATLCHACELVGLETQGAELEWAESADRGEPLSLVFELTREPDPVRHLSLTTDPEAHTVEVSVTLANAHLRPEWVYGALQLNHELPHHGLRYSMDMSNGELSLGTSLPLTDLQSDTLAQEIAEAMGGLERLIRLGEGAASSKSLKPVADDSARGLMVKA